MPKIVLPTTIYHSVRDVDKRLKHIETSSLSGLTPLNEVETGQLGPLTVSDNDWHIVTATNTTFDIERPSRVLVTSDATFYSVPNSGGATVYSHLRHEVSPSSLLCSIDSLMRQDTGSPANHHRDSQDVLAPGSYTASLSFFVDGAGTTDFYIYQSRITVYLFS